MKITYAAARINAGFTQAEVAKELGISVGTLSSWENYRNFPSIVAFADLAKLYKVSSDDLIFLPKASTLSGQGDMA